MVVIRVYLASVKAPVLAKPVPQGAQQMEVKPSEPYGWESKESLRKMGVGKKVRVEIEYTRNVSR